MGIKRLSLILYPTLRKSTLEKIVGSVVQTVVLYVSKNSGISSVSIC